MKVQALYMVSTDTVEGLITTHRDVVPTCYLIFFDTILAGEEVSNFVTNLQMWKSRLFTQLLLEGVPDWNRAVRFNLYW